jgi:FdhE protein
MTEGGIRYRNNHTENGFPATIFPEPGRIFLDRARRFDTLAEGHSLAGWLRFLGLLTLTQHELLQDYPTPLLPDEASVEKAIAHGLSLAPAAFWPRDPVWHEIAVGLASALLPHAPPLARQTLERLQAMDGTALEVLADRVVHLDLEGRDTDLLPFIGAALQVHWTALAAGLSRTELAPPAAPGICPCCGFPPVASIVRPDGEVAGLRYLHCALCNTEWHLVRVVCAACRDNNRIAYQLIEGSDGSVRAETCDACGGYLKIVYRNKSPQADPVADDLATLALDLLVAEKPYGRLGPNLLFLPGRSTAL